MGVRPGVPSAEKPHPNVRLNPVADWGEGGGHIEPVILIFDRRDVMGILEAIVLQYGEKPSDYRGKPTLWPDKTGLIRLEK